jgi:hypothetical protein
LDAFAFNKQLDRRLAKQGEVDQELFFGFSEAHGYDAASTVGWLEAKLRVLHGRLAKGDSLSLYEPATKLQRTVFTLTEFSDWVSSNFPSVELDRQ